jgi:hypothetical protein
MNLKKSFAALAVLALIVVGIVALFVPTATQGQENNGNGPPANNPRPSELLSLRTGLECPDTFSGARIVVTCSILTGRPLQTRTPFHLARYSSLLTCTSPSMPRPATALRCVSVSRAAPDV